MFFKNILQKNIRTQDLNALIRSFITCFRIFENALKATWIFRYEKYYITTIIRFQFQPFKYVFAISFAYLHFLKSSYSPLSLCFYTFQHLVFTSFAPPPSWIKWYLYPLHCMLLFLFSENYVGLKNVGTWTIMQIIFSRWQ